jgi:hypothetical protein
MRQPAAWTLPALLCSCALACAPADDPAPAAAAADTSMPAAGPPFNDRTLPDSAPMLPPAAARSGQRPDRRRVAIGIEGTTDTIAVRLVRSPPDFSPGFSTYVPDDMGAEIRSDDDGLSARFGAVFGGVPNERAYLQFYIYPPGNTLLTAQESVQGFVRGRNPEADLTRIADRYPWSDEAYVFRYQEGSEWIQGSIALGRQQDRFFHVLIQYPPE